MNFLVDLFKLSFSDPSAAGVRLIELKLSINAALSAFTVSIIIASIMIFAFNGFGLVVLFPGIPPLSPIFVVLLVGMGNLALVGSIILAGRIFQANGSFSDGVLLFAWMQMLQVLLQLFQLVLSLFSVAMAGILGLFGTGLLFWVLFGLINSWLSLTSMWRSAICFVLGLIGLSIFGSIVLVSIGFSPA
jgi:hypothetical protein